MLQFWNETNLITAWLFASVCPPLQVARGGGDQGGDGGAPHRAWKVRWQRSRGSTWQEGGCSLLGREIMRILLFFLAKLVMCPKHLDLKDPLV